MQLNHAQAAVLAIVIAALPENAPRNIVPEIGAADFELTKPEARAAIVELRQLGLIRYRGPYLVLTEAAAESFADAIHLLTPGEPR